MLIHDMKMQFGLGDGAGASIHIDDELAAILMRAYGPAVRAHLVETIATWLATLPGAAQPIKKDRLRVRHDGVEFDLVRRGEALLVVACGLTIGPRFTAPGWDEETSGRVLPLRRPA